MKKLSFIFVRFASQKLLPQFFNLPDFVNMSSSDISKFYEFQKAFNLGVRFREEFSKSRRKVMKKLSCKFPLSHIYSEHSNYF